jgi:arylsulfatase A-like enzyme
MEKRRVTAQLGAQFPRGVPSNFNAYFILEDAIDWIREQLTSLQQPFLSYVHLLPPHDPYTPRRDFVGIYQDDFRPDTKPRHALIRSGIPPEDLQRGRRDYDEYVAYADSEFGRLYDFMLQNGHLEDTILVFTSDHGEAFERGLMGHLTPLLYEPLLQVPLLISTPGRLTREDVFASTNNVDLLPTLLHLTGQPVPDWIEGQVLPPFVEESAGTGASYTVEAKSNPKRAPLSRKASIALVRDDAKLIRYIGYPELDPPYELYLLADDPEELENRYLTETALAGRLQEEMEAKLEEVNRPFGNF